MKNILVTMWPWDEMRPLNFQNIFQHLFSLTSLKVINPEEDNCKVCWKGNQSTLDATQFENLICKSLRTRIWKLFEVLKWIYFNWNVECSYHYHSVLTNSKEEDWHQILWCAGTKIWKDLIWNKEFTNNDAEIGTRRIGGCKNRNQQQRIGIYSIS